VRAICVFDISHKNPDGENRKYDTFLYWYCLVKNLLWETFVRKTHRGKRVQYDVWTGYNPGKDSPEPCNSQSHWIPIPWNMDVGMDLVSESAKWLQDYFGKMFISQYGDKTFWTIIYALIWPVSILTIQATLSLQIMVGDSMESHLITLWSHAYVILQNDKWK